MWVDGGAAGAHPTPGVYARGSRWVAVYLEDGRQRRRSASTLREAREIKIRRTAKEVARRAGPTLHSYALEWVDHYAGRGANDVINDRTRREYRRLLITYALAYFSPEERLRDIDECRARAFVDWLCRLTDDDGHRLSDRSVRNAVVPLQSCLRHAAIAGLIDDGAEAVVLLPRRRRGRVYEFDERRFLTRAQLARLLDVLLVLAMRACFQRSANAPRWYRASADPRLSPALSAMHADAAHPWTVPELAAVSGLSRAAFARSFQQALGQAPMQYLTDWRMTLARDHLRTGELTLAQIAARTGYASPYAFAAAFRRHHGQPPGQWRQQELDRRAIDQAAAVDDIHTR